MPATGAEIAEQSGAPADEQTLRVWLPPEIAPQADVPGGGILAEQLATFRQSHPDLALEWAVKSPTGPGGTLSYLRAGQDVAPSILPDLILLPADQLSGALSEQLVYPLNNLLPPEMIEDLFPAARAMAQSGDTVAGYPYLLTQIQHLVYNSAVISGTAPLSWERLITHPTASYVFPAAGGEGAELALQLYLAVGGSLTNSAGQPYLDVAALTVALSALSQGRNSGLIVLPSGESATVEEAWQIYQAGAANMVQTRASFFLAARAAAPASGYGPLPGPGGALTPLVRGWSWAVTSADPARQALAAELLAWLASAQNMGELSLESRQLPARRAAFGRWPGGDPYIEFLRQQLEVAAPFPLSSASPILAALGTAALDVVMLAQTPQAAAQIAADALQP
jgi:ABC-type glycerol-3-phosphate transport system substrate-binding protein